MILKYFRQLTSFSGKHPCFWLPGVPDNQWAETLAFACLLHALVCLLGIHRINFDPYMDPQEGTCDKTSCVS